MFRNRSDVLGLAQNQQVLETTVDGSAVSHELEFERPPARFTTVEMPSAYSAASCPRLLMHQLLRPALPRLFAELVVQSSLTAVVAVARLATPSSSGQLEPVARLEHVPSHQYVPEARACLQQMP